jgi:ABC-type phosphate/phosphonate transport system substrate-binding protein
MNRSRGLACLVLAGGVAALCFVATSQAADPTAVPKSIRIGLVDSLFRDVPDSLMETMAKPFGVLMATQTGMTGLLTKTGDANDLGRKLTSGEVQVGICHGFEYAWMRQTYPNLKILAIAVNQTPRLRASLVVNVKSDIADFADLKDKTLDIPKGSRGHIRLFLESRCQSASQCTPEDMLGKLSSSPTAEEAMDAVVDGDIQATVVDNVALDGYKKRKPGRCQSLKVVATSEEFPAGVVVYNAGSLNEKTLTKFRDGLLNTHKTFLGQQMLILWKLTGFENVPADYDQLLTDIARAYPAPAPVDAEDSSDK